MKTNSYNRGMTLVEIAIVLVIIGIVIGLGATMVGPLTKRMKVNDTKEIINAAVDAIISYAATNNRLPDNTQFTSAIRNPNDAWGKPLYYAYDDSLKTAGSVCGRKTTLLTIRRCTDTGCTTPTDIPNVAFLVLSGGGNYNNQTTGTQGVTGPAITTINVYDPDIPNIDNYTADMNRPEPYDDIVKWVNLDELRTKVGCQGAQLKILNNELPPGTVGSPYPSAAVGATLPFSVDGGATPGTFRWCIEAATTTPLPIGLTFNPVMTGAIRTPPTNSCNGTTPLAETNWISSPTLSISGTPSSGPPSTSGAYNFTVYVRDNNDLTSTNDNIAQKSFVITINPS